MTILTSVDFIDLKISKEISNYMNVFLFACFRVVDFSYMPDLAMENARNVTINLKEEHGQYVMLQLSFAAKWILISEITFFSGEKIKKKVK